MAELDLLVVGIDARANGGGLRKVERSAIDGLQFTGGNQAGIDRREFRSVQREHVAEDVAFALAGEIEVGVIGEVDDGVFVGGRGVIDFEFAACERVADDSGERAGIACFAGFADVGEFDAAGNFFALPNLIVEAVRAAVQRVGRIVDRQIVGFAVERELAFGDAVAVASDQRAEEGAALLCVAVADVAVEIVKAENDVGGVAVAIGRLERDDDAAIGDDGGFDASVGQRVRLDLGAIGHFSKRLCRHGCLRSR